jgi:beta-N-acetylhexosaminidase
MRYLFLLLIVLPLSALDFWSQVPNEELIERLLNAMRPQDLAGQVLIFAYPGETPSERLLGWIQNNNLGGVKIFGWNANNLEMLTTAIRRMQESSQSNSLKIPLFIATDQEGGWVRHVRFNTSMTSGNMSIGATRLGWDAYQTGRLIGEELKALGINFNFAPTVDLATNPEAHVIGTRAFSNNPIQAAILSVAFYKGLEEAGVIATAKHFPGHGRASEDSHGKLPKIMASWDELYQQDLLPYQYLIRENVPAIMSGHLSFPQITGNEEPASLSAFFATEVIRNRLKFNNILITDDLFMEGAQLKGRSLPEVAELAFRAGHDLILISQPQEQLNATLQRFARLAQNDTAFRERLKTSVRRIMRIKLRYLRGAHPVPLYPQASQAQRLIPAEGSKEFFFQQAARSVTFYRNQNLPWPSNPGRVLLVTPYGRSLQILRTRTAQVDVLEYSYNPFYGFDPQVRDNLRQLAERYDRILFNLVTPGSVQLLMALEPWSPKVTVLSQLSPTPLLKTPWVRSAVLVWGQGIENIELGIAAIFGDFQPRGRLPIPLTQ